MISIIGRIRKIFAFSVY